MSVPSPFFSNLKCRECGRLYPKQAIHVCDFDFGPLEAAYDYDAIKSLIDQYGVHFPPALRDEIVARYQKLDLPTYYAGINSILVPHKAGREITDVEIVYLRDAVRQYLNYGSMWDGGLTTVTAKHE